MEKICKDIHGAVELNTAIGPDEYIHQQIQFGFLLLVLRLFILCWLLSSLTILDWCLFDILV